MIGNPRVRTTAAKSVAASRRTHFGVGMPDASQSSFVRSLSIATALASTPLPV